jgi:hypothetical protein
VSLHHCIIASFRHSIIAWLHHCVIPSSRDRGLDLIQIGDALHSSKCLFECDHLTIDDHLCCDDCISFSSFNVCFLFHFSDAAKHLTVSGELSVLWLTELPSVPQKRSHLWISLSQTALTPFIRLSCLLNPKLIARPWFIRENRNLFPSRCFALLCFILVSYESSRLEFSAIPRPHPLVRVTGNVNWSGGRQNWNDSHWSIRKYATLVLHQANNDLWSFLPTSAGNQLSGWSGQIGLGITEQVDNEAGTGRIGHLPKWNVVIQLMKWFMPK